MTPSFGHGQRRILLVEDDVSLGETLRERLSQEYQLVWARSLEQALKCLKQEKAFDLLILDLGLPDGSGFQVASEVRFQLPRPSLIFLTAQSDAGSRLQGYELGAEEYIPKPFHLKELLMRVKHVLDSHQPLKEFELEGCTVNFSTMTIQYKNGVIEYPSATDIKVLQFLIEKSPQPVSRDEIMDSVWGEDKNPSHRTIDNTIVRLKKLLGPEAEKHLRSIRGVGYQWLRESGDT